MSSYEKLCRRFERLGRLEEAMGILYWDMATKMPEGGASVRGEQLATLKGIHHEMLTRPENEALFAEAAEEEIPGDWERANLREMQRIWMHATCVPARLVEEQSRRGSECEMVWRKAREDDDFARLEPYLQKVLETGREIAEIKGEAFGVSPYDALLDQFEPGGSSEQIDVIFDELADFLPGFLEEVIAAQDQRPDPIVPKGPFPVGQQKELAHRLMQAVGFDFEHGRLDTSHHPFCGGYPADVRLTTFYDEANLLKGMMGVLHETGHALYEQGLPQQWNHLPVGKARGMSIHESQSLFVEMQISRGRAFAQWVSPIYQEFFEGNDEAFEPENLYRVTSRVERGLIRVDADEVTYPAHVILRYRLEKALIAGELEMVDLPGAWRAGMKELVGIEAKDDRDGCMQDIHWMDGTFGYFPTYTLGAISAAQLRARADVELGGVDGLVRSGEFSTIIGWLRDKVHSRACRLSTTDLLREATTSDLDVSYYLEHLRSRYLPEGS